MDVYISYLYFCMQIFIREWSNEKLKGNLEIGQKWISLTIKRNDTH